VPETNQTVNGENCNKLLRCFVRYFIMASSYLRERCTWRRYTVQHVVYQDRQMRHFLDRRCMHALQLG